MPSISAVLFVIGFLVVQVALWYGRINRGTLVFSYLLILPHYLSPNRVYILVSSLGFPLGIVIHIRITIAT